MPLGENLHDLESDTIPTTAEMSWWITLQRMSCMVLQGLRICEAIPCQR